MKFLLYCWFGCDWAEKLVHLSLPHWINECTVLVKVSAFIVIWVKPRNHCFNKLLRGWHSRYRGSHTFSKTKMKVRCRVNDSTCASRIKVQTAPRNGRRKTRRKRRSGRTRIHVQT